jgi:hypothetical protein
MLPFLKRLLAISFWLLAIFLADINNSKREFC